MKKQELSPEQYRVLREKGTEPAWSGEYTENKKKGSYFCAGCGQKLFSSKDKFDSGSGWPSFTRPVSEKNVKKEVDRCLFCQPRTEVVCSKCGGHLGHVFDDGPEPTGKRYCINSVALKFAEEK